MWRVRRITLSYELFMLRLVRYLSVLVVCSMCAEEQQLLVFSSEKLLETFFRDLFEKTTAGYVLYGEKPVDLENFPERERTIPGTAERRNAVIGGLGLRCWNRISPPQKGKYFLLSSHDENGWEVLLINRPAFLEAVRKNVLLFEYKMGISSTPEGVLDSLISEGFGAVFKENIALQGIVLGYGAENAICYESGISFKKRLEPKVTPPFQMSTGPKTPEEMVEKLRAEKNWAKSEVQNLSYYKASEKNDRLKIPFSFLKNSKKSKELIKSYKKYQNALDQILAKKTFLQEVLNRFEIKKGSFADRAISSNELKDFFNRDEQQCLAELVAQTLCNTFPNQISPAFIEGMEAAERGEFAESDVKFLDILWKKDSGHVFFGDLLGRENIQCLVPNKLYFRTLKCSDSEEVLTMFHNEVQLHYLLEDSEGRPLVGSYQLKEVPKIELSKMIPGFSHGLLGMKKGEIREVFIHPDFAYGRETDFGNGNEIKATVELIDLGKPVEIPCFPFLKPYDVANYAPDILTCADFNILQNKHAYVCGLRSWDYYKRTSDLITLNAIVEKLQNCSKKPLSDSETDLLLKFEWLGIMKHGLAFTTSDIY